MLRCDPAWLRETGLPLLNQLIATIETARLGDRAAPWLGDLPNDPRLAGELAGDQHLLAIIDRYIQADDPHAPVARHHFEQH